MSTVTAVIPHYNRKELLLNLLGCLARQTRPVAEILVVDNGSSDGSAEAAESAGARVIKIGYNSGFAAAVNRGIEASRTNWVAIINNDVEPEQSWLENLSAEAQRTDVWFLTGKLLRSNQPKLIDGSFDLVSRAGCAWRAGNGRLDGPLWDKPRTICSAPFTAALFRKELFRDLGLLDERFGSYMEDVDFGLRCAVARRSGLYVPGAVARHHGSGTLGAWSPKTVRLIARNQLLLIAKHVPAGITWAVLAGQLLWGLVALRHGAFLPFLRGKADGFRMYRSLRASEPARTHEELGSFLLESESQIRDLQRQIGFDWYWRLYFALTSRGGPPRLGSACF
jgi:GT2 family glycosyltransferase